MLSDEIRHVDEVGDLLAVRRGEISAPRAVQMIETMIVLAAPGKDVKRKATLFAKISSLAARRSSKPRGRAAARGAPERPGR